MKTLNNTLSQLDKLSVFQYEALFNHTSECCSAFLFSTLFRLMYITSSSALLFFSSTMANQGQLYPTLNQRDFTKRIRNVEGCVVLAMELGLLFSKNECPTCHRNMDRVRELRKKDGFRWHCRRCRKSFSSRTGSWFANSKLSLQQALSLMFSWSSQENQRNARVNAEVVSEHTTMNWYNFCREICELALLHSPQGPKIGGPNKIVEIDESKFGKQKFHRGRRVEGVGGVLEV